MDTNKIVDLGFKKAPCRVLNKKPERKMEAADNLSLESPPERDSAMHIASRQSSRDEEESSIGEEEETSSADVEEFSEEKMSPEPIAVIDSASTAQGEKHDDSESASAEEDAAEASTSSSWCLGWLQTMALIRKNMITKIRTPVPTFFELFSPVLMMLILLAAYTLSETKYQDAKLYTSFVLDVPGPWFSLLTGSASLATGLTRRLVQQTPENDKLLNAIKMNYLNLTEKRQQPWDLDSDLIGQGHFDDPAMTNEEYSNVLRRLQDENGTVSSSSTNVFRLLDDARGILNGILKSPLPTPTFDQYVLLSSSIASLIDADDLPDILADSSYGREWGNLLTLGTLHLTPNNDVANEFWSFLNNTYPIVMDTNQVKVRVHEREKDALKFINDNLEERTWALLDFSAAETEEDFRYKIRMNYTTIPNTNQIIDYASVGLNKLYQRYFLSGYITMQRTLNAFSFSRLDVDQSDQVCSAAQQDGSELWSMPMPTAAYTDNIFYQAVGFLLGLTIAMAFMYPMSRLVKLMVEEKETRMKETLFILGVRAWAHWLSWIITSFVIFLIITVLVTYTLSAGVLKYSSAFYLFWFIGLFSSATMGFSFFIAAFFSRAKLAAVIGPVALFATLLPRYIFFGSNRYEASTGKMIASLLPCTAFAFGADIVADYEYAEQGIQSYNASEGDYSFNTALGFLFIDTILYMVLGWYLELVIPRQYGVARKWYFIVTPKYWLSIFGCFCHNHEERSKKRGANTDDGSSADLSFSSEEGSSSDYERVRDASLVSRVEISDLVKRYKKDADIPPAVDKLNLKMYESQITCLLGHNGAGKTTTISVLTGLYPPTSGDCTIYGNSIVDDLYEARLSMGICPQHNVLFDNLTVTEHMALFERIKGVRSTRDGIRERASEIGLGEYFNTTSSALSGGNKRKLSLAIALCGDPKFLILDEPTSGMDVASRRTCWELLRKKREGRVTLLTTHFMDEAELLSDRIAVMKEGRLQCCGSSLFLKNRFGLGYNLTVVLSRASQQGTVDNAESLELGVAANDPDNNGSMTVDSNAADRILAFLRSLIPDTVLVRSSARELTYRFPQGTEDMFPTVFDELEGNRESLGIGAYGITNTTLEEVFLQLAEEQSDELGGPPVDGSRRDVIASSSTEQLSSDVGPPREETPQEQRKGPQRWIPPLRQKDRRATEPKKRMLDKIRLLKGNRQRSDFSPTPDVSEMELQHMGPLRQVQLLYYKRFTVQKRDIKGFFFLVVIPVILIALVLLVLTIDLQLAGPAIELNMNLYDESPGGSSARTDVLVAGGASSSNSFDPVTQSFDLMRSKLGPKYDHADFELLSDKTTSLEVSEFLLETINDHSHDARYGAFVFRDTINLAVLINREKLRADVKNLQNEPFGSNEVIDVLGLLGNEQGSIPVEFNGSVADFSSILFSSTNLTIETGANVSDLENITSTALSNLLATTNQNETEAATDWIDAVANLTRLFNNTDDAISFFEVASESYSNGTIGISSVSTLVEALQNLSDVSALESITLLARLATPGDFFSRDAVATAYESVIVDTLELLGVEGVNSTLLVDVFIRNASEAIPSTFLAAPIIFADSQFEAALAQNENATISVGDTLGALSTLLGGDAEQLDGFLLLSVSTISLDLATMTTTVTFSVATNSNVLSTGNLTLTPEQVSDFLALILPEGTSEVLIPVNTDASIIHNATSPHAMPSFNQAYMEYLYRRCSGNANARLTSVNHPLPLTTQQSLEIRTILSVLASLFILIPFCYILGAFVVFPVKERVCKSKHLQLVSGVNMSAYWCATYLWDLTLFGILTIAIMVIFLIYGQQSAQVFVGNVESFFATMALTFGYGMSALPFSYLLSRLSDNHSTAQIGVMGIFFITGFVAVNAYFIMDQIENTKNIAAGLLPLFRCWPAFNVGEGFIRLSASFFEREILGEESHPFDWDVAGKSIALCFLLSIPYSIWLVLLEYSADGGSGGFLGRMLRTLRGSYEAMLLKWNGVQKSADGSLLLDDGLVGDDADESHLDRDVAQERDYVLEKKEELRDSASVLLANLWKVYPPSVGMFGSCFASIRRALAYVLCCRCFRRNQAPPQQDEDKDRSKLPKRAIRGLTTAIHEGETYGLLGVNGAGKTTTMAILTGDTTATGGEAYVAGHDVTGSVPGGVSEARKNIGFCPQVDPLLDLMTGRETLTMFGRLRGIPEEHLHAIVEELMDRLTLTPHADKTSESYSGGNKRKLSLGIALIGNPRVLFIDESSSGMDPAARRHMWSLIEEVSQDRSVILTTHSMEEAEALCTRVGIMVHGRLLCLGSVQHLKTTYLDGYTIDVHCERGTSNDTVDAVVDEILNNALPGSRLSERHGTMLRFDVDSLSSLGLGTTFGRLQELKQNPEMHVDNYSISQCSLEQVFISLVRREEEDARQSEQESESDEETDAEGSNADADV